MASPPAGPVRPADKVGPERNGHVILAEDDGPMRRILASGLRKSGFGVSEFADGTTLYEFLIKAVLGSALSGVADAVVSDVRMPGASGLRILHGLRSLDDETPVVLITAFGDGATHAEAARLGASVLDKPFSLGDLANAVHAAIAGRRPPRADD